jgi:predicted Zn-dependent protease
MTVESEKQPIGSVIPLFGKGESASDAEATKKQRRITSQAVDYVAVGRREKAIETLENGLELYPDNIYFLGQLGNLYRRKGDLFKAQSCLQRSHELKPRDIKTISSLGSICAERGFHDMAEEVLQRGRRLDPHDKIVITTLAAVYVQQGKYTEAQEVLEESGGLKYGNKFVIASLGNVYALQGKYGEARQVLETGFRLHPKDTYIINTLGNVYAEQGDYDAAEAILARGYKYEPGNKYVINSLGNVYARQRKFDEAEEVLLAGRRYHQNDVALLNTLGHVYLQQGAYSKASEALMAALRLDPGNVAVMTMLGHVYLKEKDFPAFEALIEETSGQCPRDGAYLYLQAKGYFLQKKRSQAKAICRELIELRGIDEQLGTLYLACCEESLFQTTGRRHDEDDVIARLRVEFGGTGFKDLRLQAMELAAKPELLDKLDPRYVSRMPGFIVARYTKKPVNTDLAVTTAILSGLALFSVGIPEALQHIMAHPGLIDNDAMGFARNAAVVSVLSLCQRVPRGKSAE